MRLGLSMPGRSGRTGGRRRGQVRRERGALTIRLVRCYLRAWAGESGSLRRDVLKRIPAGGSPRPPGGVAGTRSGRVVPVPGARPLIKERCIRIVQEWYVRKRTALDYALAMSRHSRKFSSSATIPLLLRLGVPVD